MMHKPKGLLTSRSDDRGRATVYSLLPEGEKGDRGGEWRFPVGRLDASSEVGLRTLLLGTGGKGPNGGYRPGRAAAQA